MPDTCNSDDGAPQCGHGVSFSTRACLQLVQNIFSAYLVLLIVRNFDSSLLDTSIYSPCESSISPIFRAKWLCLVRFSSLCINAYHRESGGCRTYAFSLYSLLCSVALAVEQPKVARSLERKYFPTNTEGAGNHKPPDLLHCYINWCYDI